jgi:hypothetical protein
MNMAIAFSCISCGVMIILLWLKSVNRHYTLNIHAGRNALDQASEVGITI